MTSVDISPSLNRETAQDQYTRWKKDELKRRESARSASDFTHPSRTVLQLKKDAIRADRTTVFISDKIHGYTFAIGIRAGQDGPAMFAACGRNRRVLLTESRPSYAGGVNSHERLTSSGDPPSSKHEDSHCVRVLYRILIVAPGIAPYF